LNDQVKKDEMGKECNMHGEKRNSYKVLMGKPKGKRPLGSLIRRRDDNIKMDLREIGWSGMDWINLAQDGDK
jgi:hypothetical protein